jgi:hypothetical protein
MSPKLRSVLARVVLIGGVALVASLTLRAAPHDQTIAIRLGSRAVKRVSGVVTRQGDPEPAAGFSQDFPGASPHFVRHTFSAPNDTYIVVITLKELDESGEPHETTGAESGGAPAPIPKETSFERRVSLAGGEVIVSPD